MVCWPRRLLKLQTGVWQTVVTVCGVRPEGCWSSGPSELVLPGTHAILHAELNATVNRGSLNRAVFSKGDLRG